MTRKQRRLAFIAAALATLGIALAIALYAMRGSIAYYQTPTELKAKEAANTPITGRVRVGGLVKDGTFVRGQGEKVTFVITDLTNEIAASYEGMLPDLFKEGQGVVAEGTVENGALKADWLLAKHDEKYMAKEVTNALKDKGLYKGGENKPGAMGGAAVGKP